MFAADSLSSVLLGSGLEAESLTGADEETDDGIEIGAGPAPLNGATPSTF